ncbi:MAG: hypothetical protein ACP5O7_06695 [Phycisphaerae bacterium]
MSNKQGVAGGQGNQHATVPATAGVGESAEGFVTTLSQLKTQYEAWRMNYVDMSSIIDCAPPPEEAQYRQAMEQLVLASPMVIAAMEDLRQAVLAICGRYTDLFWTMVRTELALVGITIGEIEVTARQLMPYRPVTAEPVRTPGDKSKRKIKAKIWRNPFGDEICISTTVPQNESKAFGRIAAKWDRKNDTWLDATELLVEFSNETVSRFVVEPQELKRVAAATVEAIKQFIARVYAQPRRGHTQSSDAASGPQGGS